MCELRLAFSLFPARSYCRCVHVVRWATAALMWMMQTNGIPTDQRKGSGCVKSQTYVASAVQVRHSSATQNEAVNAAI